MKQCVKCVELNEFKKYHVGFISFLVGLRTFLHTFVNILVRTHIYVHRSRDKERAVDQEKTNE